MARPTLMTHRKFRRLARALGSKLIARGALEVLWDFCYEAGTDYVGTSEDVEALIGWTGETGQLTAALVTAGAPEGRGFVEPVEPVEGTPTYRVHDLWHHAPDYVAKRRKRELDRLGRVDPVFDRQPAPNGGHSSEISDCQNEVDRTRALAPARARARALAPAPEESPVLLLFPTVGQGGTEWRLRKPQVDEWQAAYPNLDVLAECRKALAWLNANPGRRKTARGMPRFLVTWCSRAVDSGRVSRPPGKPVTVASDAGWFEECQQIHGGACGGDRMRHHLQKQTDAAKAAAS